MKDASGRFQAISIPEEGNVLVRVERPSWALAVTAVCLALVGLATVRSASTELPIDYFPRQMLWVVLGVLVMTAGFFFNYRTLLRYSGLFYAVGLVALVLILFFGHAAGGARSWVGWFGFGLQPSELAKLATLLLLVRYFATREERTLSARELVVASVIVAVPFALILLEPDLGGAVILMPVMAALVWVAGIPMRTALVVLMVLGLLAAGFWTFGLQDYQRARVLTFFSPDQDPLGSGYQLRQSKIAVGSGEVVGKGYMQGTQSQLRFLPARHTDFIFAVLAEEGGFLGVLLVLSGYGLYLFYGVRIARRARDPQGILLVVALLSLVTFHVLYNTGMMIGLVPITGIPLPFLSYGGSFTLFCFFATGLILSVDLRRYVNR